MASVAGTGWVPPRPTAATLTARARQPAAGTIPVTVVIPAYNRATALARALASVAAQRPCLPAQVVVVDDGSSDETADVARSAGAQLVRHEVNQGAAAARNSGIAAASQDWIALLDSDDEWLPHHLSTLWPMREGHGVVAGATLRCHPDPGQDRYLGSTTAREIVLRSPRLLVFPNNFIPSSAGMFRRALAQRAGGYDTSLGFAEDFDLLLRMLELSSARLSPVVISRYHAHAGQKTHRMAPSRDAQRQIVSKYADRTWWSSSLYERRNGVLLWDELRGALTAGDRPAARRAAARILRRPARVSGVIGTWAWRLLSRRRSGRVARDGGASVALVRRDPVVAAQAREVFGDLALRELGPTGAWRQLARRPPGIAVVPSRSWALAVRLLGVKPMRADALAGHASAPVEAIAEAVTGGSGSPSGELVEQAAPRGQG